MKLALSFFVNIFAMADFDDINDECRIFNRV